MRHSVYHVSIILHQQHKLQFKRCGKALDLRLAGRGFNSQLAKFYVT